MSCSAAPHYRWGAGYRIESENTNKFKETRKASLAQHRRRKTHALYRPRSRLWQNHLEVDTGSSWNAHMNRRERRAAGRKSQASESDSPAALYEAGIRHL